MTENTLHAALAAANGELTNPGKDGTANYGAYTTLGGVLDHVRPVLARHGLYVTQDVSNDDTHLVVSTTIHHASGEELTFGPMTWPMVDKIQTLGGLVTYCRRYSLMAALGLSGQDEDDDGQAAQQDAQRDGRPAMVDVGGLRGPAARARARDVSKRCSDKQLGLIRRLMAAHALSEPLLPDAVGITTPRDGLDKMTSQEASQLIDALSALPADKPIIRGRITTPPQDDPWATWEPPAEEPPTPEDELGEAYEEGRR